MKDYTGKIIFVGIDVHKATYSVAAIYDGVLVKRDTLKAHPSILIAYLKKRFGSGRILTAYESGFFRLGFPCSLLKNDCKKAE